MCRSVKTLAIAEVERPEADEAFIEAEAADVGETAEEVGTPGLEGGT